MKLYEVIFWGSRGDANAEDTIYLVRARDFRTAADFVSLHASFSDHCGARGPAADIVHELGTDTSFGSGSATQILRGPYFAFAYNRGWRAWRRERGGADWKEIQTA